MRYLYSSENVFWPDHRGETVAQVVQRGGGCAIPGTQGQLAQYSEQSGLVEDFHVYCRNVGRDDYLKSLST